MTKKINTETTLFQDSLGKPVPETHTHTHARAHTHTRTHTHTHTRTFNGPLSGNTRVSWYQKGKTNLDLLKQETVSGSGIS